MTDVAAPALPRIEHLWAEPAFGSALSGRLADAYGAPLTFDQHPYRPTVIANFVSTIDGVVSYGTPEAAGGGEISGFFGPDRFVMGLLRAASDAVLIGAGTLRAGAGEAWTPDFIYPEISADVAAMRARLGLAAQPTTVVVSASGQVDPSHPGLAAEDVPALLVTTHAGRERFDASPSQLEVVETGSERVEPDALMAELERHGFGIVLCEGGPHLLGALLERDVVDEVFLTVAPQIAGRSHRAPRLALAEGVAFSVADAPWWRLISLARSGEHLFLRYRRDRGTHHEREARP
ncbi:MAG TPA: dihydrofolate reductase family protein [Candidatus Limnocylindria bacterium]|jgi:riboflavin biosynthesis pyrimidine reductase|nr:dihydrofolate reductase family protein [Candidatus Limnocylindria bacterium]